MRLEQVMPALNRVMALDGTEIWGVIPARPLIQHLHQRCAVVAQDPGLISLDWVNQDRDRGSMGRWCTAELIDIQQCLTSSPGWFQDPATSPVIGAGDHQLQSVLEPA